MNKKNIALIIIILLFSGIMALTQEYNSPDLLTDINNYDNELNEEFAAGETIIDIPDWITPPRWFRSNKGGMALEEIPSRLSALRYEYALVIDFISCQELPDYLLEYYNENYFIEMRILFKKTEETRRQWIFRDRNGSARFIAVFSEPAEKEENDEIAEMEDESESTEETEILAETRNDKEKETVPVRYGFIEIYDKNYFLSSEFKYYDNGNISKTDFFYKDGIITKAVYSNWEKTVIENKNTDDNEEEIINTEEIWGYKVKYTDTYRYNRSLFLRSVERKYHQDDTIKSDKTSVSITFPQKIHDTAQKENFLNEKLNAYPDFLGEVFVSKDNEMQFITDKQGRILTQTLVDNNGNIIWEIKNNWSKDRILSIVKTEKDVEFLTEFEYDSGGNRIIEKDFKNGVLERIVRTENNIEIEELYLDNVLVLTAVWEDGRKKSETRIKY